VIPLLTSVALAGQLPERNLSVTHVGVQVYRAPALAFEPVPGEEKPPSLEPTDADLIFGQRLRWTLFDNGATALRLRMNGRFTLSPGDAATWKRNRVQQLGVSVVNDRFTLDVGRHPVLKGGPRLVDGLQFVAHASDTIDVGVWGGLAPDLYTTDPKLHPGFGPIVAFTASRMQASIAGDIVLADGLSRMGTLVQGRMSAARTLDFSVRADLDLAGGFRIADAQVFARWAPHDNLRIDGFYNAFSSFLYQNVRDVDPDIQRFEQRIVNQLPGFLPVIAQNCLDPSVNHMLGGDIRIRPQGMNTGLLASVSGRYRMGSKAETTEACFYADANSYVRIHPRVGVANLPVGGGLDVTLDANLYSINGFGQSDAGVTVFFEPLDDGILAVDASYRMLFNRYEAPIPGVDAGNPEGYRGTGHYADLFVDVVVVPADLMVGVGTNVEVEPSEILNDVGIGGYARLTKYIRPGRRSKRSEDADE
jgi:hypothetical protein